VTREAIATFVLAPAEQISEPKNRELPHFVKVLSAVWNPPTYPRVKPGKPCGVIVDASSVGEDCSEANTRTGVAGL
jgi:hypothetical protein